jgi:biopolymer transport protein ExbD
MRRSAEKSGQLPEVNLVPMLDVLMTILTFFIIISMTLTGQAISNVQVPILGKGGGKEEEQRPQNLTIGLDRQGQIILDSKPATVDDMAKKMVDFLNTNPEGTVILKADSKLTYSKVVQLLEVMRDIGGDRVSLAVDRREG